MTGLVATSESEVIVLPVNSNMFIMSFGEFFDSVFDELHTSSFPHGLGREVGVAASTVPFALERFGVEGNLDAPLLSDANKKIPGHPKVVAHRNAFTRSHLELPLRRHHFSIDTADVDTSIEAGTIVCLNEVTRKDFAGAYCTTG